MKEHTILYKDISFESEHEIRFESKFNFIPWLQIKLASVQLAKKYMERVTSELDALQGTEKEPNREFLLLQGVRFAFRVHQVYNCPKLTFQQYVYIITGKLEIFQIKNLPFAIAQFAGGFDADSMKVFEELRSKMSSTQAPAPPASDT